MADRRMAFEDFREGETFRLGSKTLTAAEIVDFAEQFDMQPMHLDEAVGKASILGGLSASGWHTCATFMRLMCDGFLLNSTSQGAPGVDYARWKRPVLAGDTLTGASTVLKTRMSSSRPGLGFVTCRHELTNQHGKAVLEMQNTGMFLTREAAGL